MTKDYYRILGVLDDAEDIVIRAAYKALAQRYHPDKWTGSKEDANKRMSKINEAYGILSDTLKRKKYDSTRENHGYQEDDESDEDEILSSLEKDWKEVIEYFPDLMEISDNLSKISKQLDFSFKSILLEKKDFKNRFSLANTIETVYLQKYFGKNPQLIIFAKKLILDGRKEDAKKLNRAIELLGSAVDPEIVIKKILGEEKKSSDKGTKKQKTKDPKFFTIHDYAENFIVSYDLNYGLQFFKLLGGNIFETRILKGVFGSEPGFEVTYKNVKSKQFDKVELIDYLLPIAKEFLVNT